MKITTIITILMGFLSIITAQAQSPSPTRLLGDRLIESDAVKKADFIVIGQFVSLGNPNLDSENDSYSHAVISITQSLKGQLNGEIKASFALHFSSVAAEREIKPRLNTDYLIFLEGKTTSALRIIKLLTGTDDNVTKVKTSIAGK